MADQLAAAIAAHATGEGPAATAIPGLYLSRYTTITAPPHAVDRAILCVVAQGAKRVLHDQTRHEYGSGTYFVLPLDLPLVGQIAAASPEAPCLGVTLELDLAELATLGAELGAGPAGAIGAPLGSIPAAGSAGGLAVTPLDAALRDALTRPVTASASIGIVHWDGSATPSELLRNADLAMYRAKAAGKAGVVVFDLHMQAAARTRLELASDLREAIRAQEIHAVFQPIVDLVSGRAVKAEALARWTHPTRGVVPPSVFIPLAEETGLIDELGALMLRHGCRQLAAWQRAWQQAADAWPADAPPADGRRAMGVTVNVSGHQVDHGTLVDAVRAALDESGADAAGLTVELTESVAMRQPERLLEMLAELAASGVTLAIDDFGTGYSSLSYLHRFPVDVLKIDKSFVDHLGEEPRNAHAETLVRTIVSIARSLGLQTVAEGVETAPQRDALVALGCDLGQGYLFGRPVLAAELDVSR